MVNLSCLASVASSSVTFSHVLRQLNKGESECEVQMLESARPCFLASLHQRLQIPFLLITSSPEKARLLYEQFPTWCPDGIPILHFPEPDSLPYERLALDTSIMHQRLQVLSILQNLRGGNDGARPIVIIASVFAIVQKTLFPGDFASVYHMLSTGANVKPQELLTRWISMGYQRETLVEVPGTASQRGGILDIFPPNCDLPLRLEFIGNEIESIRFFDPQTQRSLKPVSSAYIAPAVEATGDATILEYLPPNVLVILDEPTDLEAAVCELDSRASELRQEQIGQGELSEDSIVPYLLWPELEGKLRGASLPILKLSRWPVMAEGTQSYAVDFTPVPSYAGKLTSFLEQVQDMLPIGERIIVVSHQAKRLSELLGEEDIFVCHVSELEQLPPPGSIYVIQGSLQGGWRQGQTLLLTDSEIFGFVKQSRLLKKRPVRRRGFLPELGVGDYAVHDEHGIGMFGGMVKVVVNGVQKEYLLLEYAAGDKLYIPTDQADCVTRYIGSGGQAPSLSRLGTQEWERTKRRIKEKAKDIARELIVLHALRETSPGFAFAEDTPWQEELEASFPYVETPDQMEAVIRIKEDMESAKPMDRLVCGDVGYGKTEVALRAAFKAVMNSRQVALLVPTTVLAQQHFNTFTQRLSAFPVRVEMLSRFRSEKEQKAIIEDLAEGSVDICIGTHRLLQKDVVFKDLGLVIIDEEQRFGVTHKERLKQMRQEVDILTLSATPIPRTLHMALVGVRDMSTMETPPEERLPIKTFVGGYSDKLVREAIIREMERGGQVFFVHNRVQNIARVTRQLQELVPEAEIAVAHGQMSEEKLEQAMLDFTNARVDVLLCTTIIQAGLDIANVNTLIVNDADKLGLTQLYQLRGRVGRGSNRAYAYFLFNKSKRLTDTALKRLQTITEATELGAGFQIAMKDLEIRGAGNLLGAEQSGHIAAVGFDLYCQLLAEAVEDAKAKMAGQQQPSHTAISSVTVDLPLSAYIPEEYVDDPSTRLSIYQRMARMKSTEEVDQMAVELRDRFGRPPASVRNLLFMVNLKSLAKQARASSVSYENRHIVVSFGDGVAIDRVRVERPYQGAVRAIANEVRLDTRRLGGKWRGVLKEIMIGLASQGADRVAS